MAENHLALFKGEALKADERTVCMLNRSEGKSTQTLLLIRCLILLVCLFFIERNMEVFLHFPIQILPTLAVRISPVMKSISTAGGEYYICNVTN